MKTAIKIAVSLALLALLAWQIDWGLVLARAVALKWWAIPLAIILHIAVYAAGTVRWWRLLAVHRLGLRFPELLRLYFMGTFFNQLLPSATGGDLLRIYYVYKQQHGAAAAISPVLMERVIGLAVMIALVAAVLPFIDTGNELVTTLGRIMPMILLVTVAGFLLLGYPRSYGLLHRFFARWDRVRLVATLLRIAEAAHGYVSRPAVMLQLVGLSVAMQFVEIGCFWVLGQGVGATLSYTNYLLTVPLIFIAAALPVSIGGLGVREMAAIALFTGVGMNAADAAAVALLYIPVLLVSSLPGLYFFLRMKNHQEFFARASEEPIAS